MSRIIPYPVKNPTKSLSFVYLLGESLIHNFI